METRRDGRTAETAAAAPERATGLEMPLMYLKGVGPRRAAALEEVGLVTVGDLLRHYPRRYLDRTSTVRIRELDEAAETGQSVTVIGQVRAFSTVGRPPWLKGPKGESAAKGGYRFVLVLEDETGRLDCVWFAQAVRFVAHAFQIGEWVAVHGVPRKFGRQFSLTHPEFDKLSFSPAETADEADEPALPDAEQTEAELFNTGGVVALYPTTDKLRKVGLDSRGFRRLIRSALDRFGAELPETLSGDLIARYGMPGHAAALASIHLPRTTAELDDARDRLKFDEFFFLQLLLALRHRAASLETSAVRLAEVGDRFRALHASLPYELTGAQKRVIREIRADSLGGHPMTRMVQGDVGSGKTIVALFAMLLAVDNGYQAAFMAPTEILAEQHYLNIRRMVEPLGVKVELLVGKQRKKARTAVLAAVESGAAQIVVGTHALIQEGVTFGRLGMAIVDEQHRFGVVQRALLKGKGESPHVLVMTATPIPRTLSMTVYGDLDTSILDELPANRKPIRTAVRREKDRPEVYQFLRDELDAGRQAYIVYPLVETSEKLDLKAATEACEQLREGELSGYRVGLIHGKMDAWEKDVVMSDFKARKLHALVATTVIEVGIDVPNASVMLIEHAGRFGLSQLHQLRGRVGRGADQSFCVLMADPKLSLDGYHRLKTLADTTDGFAIAEADLRLRGPGDFFGVRQSGLPDLKLANPVTDEAILTAARAEAFGLVERDPQLRDPAHQPIREHFLRAGRQSLGMAEIA